MTLVESTFHQRSSLAPGGNPWPRSSKAAARGDQPTGRALEPPSDPTGSEHPLAIAFGRYNLLTRTREILADGAPLPLGSRALEVLLALIEAGGELVTKDDLMRRVWPGRIVEEHNLHFHISSLRKALGADRGYIRTVSGRGYRFVAEFKVQSTAPHEIEVTMASDAVAARLKALEFENGLLRRAIADLVLDKLVLQEAVKGMRPMPTVPEAWL